MSRIANQIDAAQQIEEIYTEWKINPAYPEDPWGEFDRVMSLVAIFVKDEL
jgi:hypothetical protein